MDIQQFKMITAALYLNNILRINNTYDERNIMKKIFIILSTMIILLTGCSGSNNYGYDSGYDAGYHVGYNSGYSEAEKIYYEELNSQEMNEYEDCIPLTDIDYWIYENMYDYDILTVKCMLEDLEDTDKEKVISILSDYYSNEDIYGDFVGDNSTKLLHATAGECFNKIEKDNLVLFDGSIDYVLNRGYYQKCNCIDEYFN